MVQYEDENDEDRATSSSYRNYEDALKEAIEIAGRILKEESEAIGWDEGDLERYKDFKKAVKGKDLDEAFSLWEDLSGDLGFLEEVTIEESTLS